MLCELSYLIDDNGNIDNKDFDFIKMCVLHKDQAVWAAERVPIL